MSQDRRKEKRNQASNERYKKEKRSEIIVKLGISAINRSNNPKIK